MPDGAPLWFRALNGAGALATRLGRPPRRLDPAALERRATRCAGLADFGGGRHREGLERLCRSLEAPPALHTVGRLVMRETITNALVQRLRLVERQKRAPAVFEAALRPPLVVVGLPRSGTTLLHRLLSLADGARPLCLWEVLQPLPGPGRDRRRRRVRRRVRAMRRLAPGYDAKHHLDADEPDECVLLLDASFENAVWCMMAPAFDYADWVRARDPFPAYRMYRRFLQTFQAATPDLRLTLKSPLHMGYLDALVSVIPEVRIVQTHRDPLEVVPSLASLLHSMYGVVADVHQSAVEGFVADVMGVLVDRNLETRPHVAADRLVDVAYRELEADPLDVTRRVHAALGLEWSRRHETRARGWLDARPRHRFGVHRYALGSRVTATDLARRFATYRRRFVPEATRRGLRAAQRDRVARQA